MKRRRLLILGPSFRRRTDDGLLPAIERFDGVFFRVARKHLSGRTRDSKNTDLLVMKDDLTLIDGDALLTYAPPAGRMWSTVSFLTKRIEESREFNQSYLEKKVKGNKYCEVFVAMGKNFAAALPDLSKYDLEVIFPTTGGIGPKATALMEWLVKNQTRV